MASADAIYAGAEGCRFSNFWNMYLDFGVYFKDFTGTDLEQENDVD